MKIEINNKQYKKLLKDLDCIECSHDYCEGNLGCRNHKAVDRIKKRLKIRNKEE